MMLIIAVIAVHSTILVATSVSFTNASTGKTDHLKDLKQVAIKIENHSRIYSFTSACMTFWNLKNPKIFVNEEISAMELYLKLSGKYQQAVVHVGFNENVFKEIVFRDDVPANVFIFGDKTVILKALQLAFHYKLRIYYSNTILVCLKCEELLSLDHINGKDFLGRIIIGIPIDESNMQLSLYGVSYEYHNRSLSQKEIGSWDAVNGLHAHSLLRNNQYSFKNATLNILIAPVDPYIETISKVMPQGFVISIFDIIKDMLNFSSVNHIIKAMSYGDIDGSGKFNGIMGNFIDEKYDIGIGAFSSTPNRRIAVDYTIPYFKENVGIVYRKPSTLSRETRRLLMKSFNSNVWLAVIIFGLLLILTVAMTFRLRTSNTVERVDLGSTLLSIWLQRGKEEGPSTASAKIVIFTSCVFWWIIFCFYNSVLITYLTLDTTSVITSIEEMAKSEYKFGMLDESAVTEILRTSKNTLFQSIHKKIYMMHPTAYMQGICNVENYAVLSSIIMILSFENLTCEVMKMKETVMIDYLHFITQKNSVLDKRFSNVIMKLRENGIATRMEKLYRLSGEQNVNFKTVDSYKSISLEHLFGPFVILIFGIFLSLIALMLEIIQYKVI